MAGGVAEAEADGGCSHDGCVEWCAKHGLPPLSAEESLEESLPELRAEVKPLVLRAIGADRRCRDLLGIFLKEVPAVRQPQADQSLGEAVDVKGGGLGVESGAEGGSEIVNRPHSVLLGLVTVGMGRRGESHRGGGKPHDHKTVADHALRRRSVHVGWDVPRTVKVGGGSYEVSGVADTPSFGLAEPHGCPIHRLAFVHEVAQRVSSCDGIGGIAIGHATIAQGDQEFSVGAICRCRHGKSDSRNDDRRDDDEPHYLKTPR
jgi:hypothetical protein